MLRYVGKDILWSRYTSLNEMHDFFCASLSKTGSFFLRFPLKEFKLHGVHLQGPCASLRSAGCRGKYVSNVQRDILRKANKNDMQARHWLIQKTYVN